MSTKAAYSVAIVMTVATVFLLGYSLGREREKPPAPPVCVDVDTMRRNEAELRVFLSDYVPGFCATKKWGEP